ncbi:MAG: response regulator transcription factor [Nocardioides sp.]
MTPIAPPRAIRVTLTGESELVRSGFAAMLAPYADQVSVLTTQDPAIAPADLTLYDWPGHIGSGTDRLAGLLGCHGVGAVVIYSWESDSELGRAATTRGTCGWVAKQLRASALVPLLRRLHAEAGTTHSGPHEVGEPLDFGQTLTPRETYVVALITAGLDNRNLATRAGLSINSVKSYIRTAYRKMGVSSRSQAVLWGVDHGYLDHPAAVDVRADGAMSGVA